MWSFVENRRLALRSFLGGQDKELWNYSRVIQTVLHEVEHSKTVSDDVREHLAACAHYLEKVHHILKRLWITYTAYDEAWASMIEIRHRLCWIAPKRELIRIALIIRDDVGYLKDDKEKKECKKSLEELIKKLVNDEFIEEVVGRETASTFIRLSECRAKLNGLSQLTALPRQAQWYKINLYRTRLLTTTLFMAAVEVAVVVGLTIWPTLFGIESNLPFVVLGVVAFGMLGGFLSAVQKRESATATSVEFYVEHILLVLRPLVGAAAALIAYVAQLAQIITIGGAKNTPALYFAVAFAAGLSQRLILKKLGSILKPKDDKDDDNDEDSNGK